MNISDAKQIRLVDFLCKLGFSPVKRLNYQYWYIAPYREEKTASFKVNGQLNEWYDFGTSEGGSIIELGMKIYNTHSISDVLRRIGEATEGLPSYQYKTTSVNPADIEEVIQELKVLPLTNHALLSYIASRNIDTELAKLHCVEIHYDLRRRHYFSIAFRNKSGGFEVRNPYFKGCIMGKDISHILHEQSIIQKHVCVFEGFMDFLSYLTLKKEYDTIVCVNPPCDYIIMNSVNNLKKTLYTLESYEYIHCYLDNDLAGIKTVETYSGFFGMKVVNEAIRYSEYKDLNDYLKKKKMLKH